MLTLVSIRQQVILTSYKQPDALFSTCCHEVTLNTCIHHHMQGSITNLPVEKIHITNLKKASVSSLTSSLHNLKAQIPN